MKFAQVIEFTTTRIDEFNARLDAWMTASERNFGTWQGRLPQELRLRGIGSLEAANRFLREHYIDEFNARLDAWMTASEGHRIPHRAVLRRDRDADDVYLLMVEFTSYDQAMENSRRPETGEFAAFLTEISQGALQFRNLDVLREENL